MADTSSIDRILQDLNPAQKEAVLHESGPLFILAGAGSGKTRAITHRIARLIQKGHPPDGILAITFTNKAAEEMKERTERLCGLKSAWVSTFHSLAARILRRHIHRIDPYDNSFTIYDADDCRALIREILQDLDIDTRLWPARSVQEKVSHLKNTTTGDIEATFGSDLIRGQKLRSIYLAYVERMRERNAVDFDDLLLLAVRLFEEHADVLERYQEQFQHVLIDEYQDTNAIQYRIGKLLSAAHRNICITGDPDQSIYRWRGADISNILNFESDYPDAKVIVLDQNYRSTMNILHAANSLIAHNRLRHAKSLWSARGDGEPVRVYRFIDEGSEAREIASLVRGAIDEGTPSGDIAIFYRINSLSRAIEQELIYANVPYSIVGGIAFFLRKEVKDVLAYLRILDNPRDVESLKRIINVPGRGIGAQSLEKLLEGARGKPRGLLDVILQGTGVSALARKSAEAVQGFADLYRGLAARREEPPADLVRAVIEATGYGDYLRTAFGDEAAERLENVGELINAAEDFGRKHPEGTLTQFLELVNLLGDVDRWERRTDRVALMSLHSAKGLEFSLVVIAAVEDGIVPLSRGGEADLDLEEERRLFYVGLTRAKERLYLTHASNRMRFGRTRSAYPSRFLREIQSPGAGAEESFQRLEMDAETEESLSWNEERETAWPAGQIEFDDRATGWPDDFADSDEEPYPVGTRVRHDTYGDGEVVRISGLRERARLTIRFDGGEEKQFQLGFAPIRRIR